MEIKIEQKAYEDLRKLVKKLKEVSDEYKEIKDETLIRLLATAFAMGKIREEKIKNKILQEIEKEERDREICAYNIGDYDEGGAKFQSGFASGLRHAKVLIKKAFEGLE